MALSAGAIITGLNHILHATADNTISTLYKLEIPGKEPKTEILIVYTNYWYRTTWKQKQSVICTGVVALASPAARTINYHLVCFALIWQFST